MRLYSGRRLGLCCYPHRKEGLLLLLLLSRYLGTFPYNILRLLLLLLLSGNIQRDTDTDTDTDTGNVQSRTYAMGEAAIRDRARTTPDH
jgi:hypothetical protein